MGERMEATSEIKPTIWKTKKMYWFDRETSEAERGLEYPLKVRMMIVNGLRDDNTMWYATAEIRGREGDFDPKTKLENAYRAMDMASHYSKDHNAPVTDEEWAQIVEEDRVKHSGTYFDEASIPSAIQSAEPPPE